MIQRNKILSQKDHANNDPILIPNYYETVDHYKHLLHCSARELHSMIHVLIIIF